MPGESVKLDKSAVGEWQNRITSIQISLLDNLSKFLKTYNEINYYFEGEASTGVLESINTYVKNASEFTQKLSNLKNNLSTVVQTLDNQ